MRYFTCLLIIFCGFLTSEIFAQESKKQSAPVVNDLVIEIPKADPYKLLPSIKQKLNEISGVSFQGFCDSRKLIFLRVQEESFFNVLIAMKELDLVYYIKHNTSIESAKEVCASKDEINSTLTTE